MESKDGPQQVNPQLLQDILESEEQFHNQFDRNSATFHGGDPTAVPIGGERVPESMPTVYDKAYIEKVSAASSDITQYGPEYVDIHETRELLLELKKTLAKLCIPIEAKLRIKGKHYDKEKEEVLLVVEQEQLKKVHKEIEVETEKIAKSKSIDFDTRKKLLNDLKLVCDGALKDYQTKEDFTTYSFTVKNCSSKVFAAATKLMEAMKKIKRAKENAPKTVGTKEESKEESNAGTEKKSEGKFEEFKDPSKDF